MYFFTDKNGKLKCQEAYDDPLTGKRKQITVTVKDNSNKAKHEAQKKIQYKIAHVGETHAKDNLSDLIEAYIRDKSVTNRASTMKRTRTSLNMMLKIVGDVKLDRLTAGLIRKQLVDKGVAPSTCNEYYKKWKACLRWGYKNDYLPDLSIVEKLERFDEDISYLERIEDKYLETDEFKTLLSAMEDFKRMQLFTSFMVLSGCRIGEVIALNKDDIKDSYIDINKNYDYTHDLITPPKNRYSIRQIYIQPELRDLIDKINKNQIEQQKLCGYKPTEYFFTASNGKRFSYNFYRRYLKKVSTAALGHPITSHALRHTSVSMFLMRGMSVEAVGRRVGHGAHSSVTMEIYRHLMNEDKLKENKLMDSIYLLGNLV